MPEPTDNDIGYDLGMTEDQIGKEHDKFMDYWRAKAGAGGVKLDWNATFRNWLRKASDAYKEIPTRQQSNSNGHYRQR